MLSVASTTSQDALQQLRTGHTERCIVRAGGNALRFRRRIFSVGIAQVARRSFELADHRDAAPRSRVMSFDKFSPVGFHENTAVGAVRGTQAAANAMVLNDDLKMFAAMDGVHGAADHAVRIEAGTARGRHDEVGESFPIAKQTRNRDAV